MEVHVGWASETGNTLDLMREFLNHCQEEHIKVASVQQLCKETELLPGIWIFFVSTTGQGSPPYRMRPFWKQLMAKNYKLKYPISLAVYSLGDSSYGDHFGMAARKLRQRLKMLGAQEFVEIALGDDMDPQGYRHAYLKTWRTEVTNFLRLNAKKFEGEPVQLRTPSLRNLEDELSLRSKRLRSFEQEGKENFLGNSTCVGRAGSVGRCA
uniref:Flavodoxin-like domain-containing protein n=1 Tax=Nymphaea colorata TaxID=210225 RepID=A0A5K1HLG0_9MAGN|nr:unnamed protein product [Nymphaea colorata]